MKVKYIFLLSFLVFLFLTPVIGTAKPFVDYQSNLKLEVPEGWKTDSFDNGPKRCIVIFNSNMKEYPIMIIPTVIEEFQTDPKFLNTRSFYNWPDVDLADMIQSEIIKIKKEDPETKILISKIVSSYNNKSIFIIFENKVRRELSAITLINGIKYYIFAFLDTPQESEKITETMTPIFLTVIKSMQSAY